MVTRLSCSQVAALVTVVQRRQDRRLRLPWPKPRKAHSSATTNCSEKIVQSASILLSSNAQGIPVAIMRKPKTRNVHCSPNLSVSACAVSGRTVAPRPPPALAIPLAVPSLLLSHWRGKLSVAEYRATVFGRSCRRRSGRGSDTSQV